MLDRIRSLPAYQDLLSEIRKRQPVQGLGLMRSARLPILAALHADLQQPVLLITDRTDHALTLLDELNFWTAPGISQYFPEPNPLFYENAAWGTVTRRDRLQSLTRLATYSLLGAKKPEFPPIIIAPVRAVMTRTLPRRDFIKNTRVLKVNTENSPEALLRNWVNIGYQFADTVVEPGQFARRGGILDIWPPAEALPLRLDFFGDEIDTMRQFDPATQRTVSQLDRLMVTPAREILAGYTSLEMASDPGFDEFSLPIVHPTPASVLDYLPAGALIFLDDMDLLQNVANEIEEQSVKLRADSIQEGTLAADFPLPYTSWSELADILSSVSYIEMGYSSRSEPSALSDAFQPGPRYAGRLPYFLEFLSGLCQREQPAVVVSRQVARLKELWDEQRNHKDFCIAPDFIEGTLGEGWALTQQVGKTFHLITDSEIFGWERPLPRQRSRPVAESPEASYADLKPGDWVVHIDYGIGRFNGLIQRTLEGVEREFLCVAYAQGDQLFVPVHQADRISRYIGTSGEIPNLTRLGSGEWTQTKQRVRQAVVAVAQELLELYAARQAAEGFSFSPDQVWQHDLEASFPYVETEDQAVAIREVKQDMEKPRPMDRLLCGDVGYGKTEVALRAAFKAVMDGKQVALLVPTTVLAQQHYETFRQRLAPFPVEVEMLSRFRSPRQQDEIILKAALGEVDILIGTHRLIQQDVILKDLGLLIIDEEQRFGVTHKEHFKKLRTEVDVLTLTATPIPRTLYMALTGVRDISQINTPPADRLPIITHIGPYSQRLVRQAILRELERGGQVFFVHNRVQTIRSMESHLHKLVPEARIGVGHGQMPEADLSRVMSEFTRREIDVLLSTSIIESGLDIPNANTLIVDRGDTFGLAQLYQLRGRVGRGAQRAYAYFFRHQRKTPTIEGQERLEIIAENTQLGAGYSIAMRDLEMRGAGELLGTRQHGYIASVGFHLYTRLLAQAVRQIRQVSGLPAPEEKLAEVRELTMAVNVDLPMPVGIPGDYVADQNIRIRLYRRIADVEDDEGLEALEGEFKDRFGPLPDQTKNLFYQMHLKLRAEQAGLASITIENDQLVFKFPPLPEGVQARELPPIGFGARQGRNAYWLPFNGNHPDWRVLLLDVLSAIIALWR